MGILRFISLASLLTAKIAYGVPLPTTPETSFPGGGSTKKFAEEVSSRFVSDEIYESYVVTRANSLKVTLQGLDPFGNVQDLTVKPSPKAQSLDPSIRSQEDKVPLSEVIKGIKVTMVFAGDKRIVVGPTSYKVGDKLKVRAKGKYIELLLTEVTSDQLTFRSIKTGEVATRSSSQRPKGMVPGGTQATPQGFAPTNQSPPIIDVGIDESAP